MVAPTDEVSSVGARSMKRMRDLRVRSSGASVGPLSSYVVSEGWARTDVRFTTTNNRSGYCACLAGAAWSVRVGGASTAFWRVKGVAIHRHGREI